MSQALRGSFCASHSGRVALPCRRAFAGRKVASTVQKVQQRRQGATVRAFIREWPDPEFIAEVKEEFPDKGVATVEEARVLFSEDGYTYLDVRPALELEEVGKVKGCVNVPMMHAKRVYDPKENKKVVQKEENPDWIEQVKKRFPDTETKLLVACNNGRTYTMDALMALDEEGYTNIVGLKGGYYAWFRVFDNKLGRRKSGEYAEQYTHDGDSCGIHSSGAGFARVDSADQWVPPVY
ncbi:probable thiosulfate sulfurtransferase 16, chloroplastic [Coccomyxa sp. Obi]|nr:probable thiosulfate sulfurtransferase 16, chloroplastic [Coccomyxa sp. Obi]